MEHPFIHPFSNHPSMHYWASSQHLSIQRFQQRCHTASLLLVAVLFLSPVRIGYCWTCCHVRKGVAITYPPADPWKQKRTEMTQKSSLGIDVGPWRLSFTHSSSVSDMAAAAGFTRLSGEDEDKRDELPAWRHVWFPHPPVLLHKSQTPSRVRWEDRHRSPQSTYFQLEDSSCLALA